MRVLRSLAGAVIVSMALTTAVEWLLDRSAVSYVIRHAAWALTPWRDIDSWLRDEHVVRALNWPFPPFATPALVPVPLALVVLAGMLLMGLLFCVTFATYRIAGWPTYACVAWAEVYHTALRRFAWRSVWVLPAVTLIAETIRKFGGCFAHARYPLIWGVGERGLGDVYTLLCSAGLVVLYAGVAARAIRQCVRQSIALEEQRCGTCGYPRRGLESPRCPECGDRFDAQQASPFEFGRPTRLRRRSKALVVAGLPIALVLWPVWAALFALCVPELWIPYLPPGLASAVAAVRSPLDVPAYQTHAWILRDRRGVAIVHARSSGNGDRQVRWVRWDIPHDLVHAPPPREFARLTLLRRWGGAGFVRIGVWLVALRPGDAGVMWLATDISIKRVPLAEVAGYLAYCDAPPASAPTSAPTTQVVP